VQKVDLALRAVVDELQHELSERGIDAATAGKMLTALEQRLPEVKAIRVARADGLVVLGKGVDTREPVSWAARLHSSICATTLMQAFIPIRLQKYRNRLICQWIGSTFSISLKASRYQIFGPVMGRVSKQYVRHRF
jgi:hypothetical protein